MIDETKITEKRIFFNAAYTTIQNIRQARLQSSSWKILYK